MIYVFSIAYLPYGLVPTCITVCSVKLEKVSALFYLYTANASQFFPTIFRAWLWFLKTTNLSQVWYYPKLSTTTNEGALVLWKEKNGYDLIAWILTTIGIYNLAHFYAIFSKLCLELFSLRGRKNEIKKLFKILFSWLSIGYVTFISWHWLDLKIIPRLFWG